MMKNRIVLDTNIYISALMKPSSNPGKVLKRIIGSHDYELVVSEPILDEILRVLFYPKIRKYIHGSDEDLKHWIQAIAMIAHTVSPQNHNTIIVDEDPDDDKFILAALEGKAKLVVSGDSHLLKLKKYRTVKILTATEFLTC